MAAVRGHDVILGLTKYKDTYATSVVALLHFDGTNGSTTFTDQIPGNSWSTMNGTPTISTAQSKFGGSSLAGASSGGITTSPITGPALPTGDATTEFWVLPGVSTATEGNTVNVNSGLCLMMKNNILYYRSSFVDRMNSGTLAAGWHFIAMTQSGTTKTLFVDGVLTATCVDTAQFGARQIATDGTANPFNGYIDEVRQTNGVVRYTATFTPPNSPFPNP